MGKVRAVGLKLVVCWILWLSNPRNILQKLGVSNRPKAIARVRELGLVV
jgi:hypothetical protein